MEADTPHDQEVDEQSGDSPSGWPPPRTLFYFGSAVIIFTAVLVALVTASSPPSEDARIVLIDSAGSRLPSNDTVKALRQTCAQERIETPSWQWSLFRPTEIGLRCVIRNRDTNLPSTLVWRFSDFGRDQAGRSLVLLTAVDANGQPQDAYAAGYFLMAVLHAM